MKLDAFLFLQQSDIAEFCRYSSQFRGLKLIFIDPGIAEEAMLQGLEPANFDYRPLPVGRHFQARAAAEAVSRALALDHALTAERIKLLGEGMFAGWDHVPFRFFFLRILVSRQLGELCDKNFPETAIGLFRPRKPQQFYFDSFVNTDIFAGGRERWRVVGHYDEVKNWAPRASSACFDFDWITERVYDGSVDALVHIPTVYSHHAHYLRAISESFTGIVDLPSPFWDIPIDPRRRPLLPLSNLRPIWLDDRCIEYRTRASSILDRALADVIPNAEPRRIQANLMADQCYLQALNYLGLMRALQGTCPHFVVTEHDTGAVGPLFSVAERLGSPITVIPHSSYPTQPLPHSVKVTAIERDGFASPVRTVWGARVRTRPIRFSPRPEVTPRSVIRTVCLLLNALSARGISYIDLANLATFYHELHRTCGTYGIRVVVRLKPGAACLPVAAGTFGLDPAALREVMELPIDHLAASTDLCISYGELTSGVIDFLEAGSLVMHVSEEARPNDLLNSSDLSTLQSLLSLAGPEAIACVEEWLKDPARYVESLGQQVGEFSSRLVASDDGSIFDASPNAG